MSGLAAAVRAILDGESDLVCGLANASAVIKAGLDRLNWAGFYIVKKGELVLGPFQGLPACTRIAPGRGVCGCALAENRSVNVPDVHEFPGHIACDSASNSELVVPLRVAGKVWGVLDLDSTEYNRFGSSEQNETEEAAAAIEEFISRLSTRQA